LASKADDDPPKKEKESKTGHFLTPVIISAHLKNMFAPSFRLNLILRNNTACNGIIKW